MVVFGTKIHSIYGVGQMRYLPGAVPCFVTKFNINPLLNKARAAKRKLKTLLLITLRDRFTFE
jgi:hypothetical protein